MHYLQLCGKRFWICWVLVVVVFLGFLMSGCAPSRVTTFSSPGLADTLVQRMGVMPFFKGRHPSNVKQTLNCNLCQLAFDPTNVIPGAENTLTRYVQVALRKQYGERLIPQDEVGLAYEALVIDEAKDTPLSLTRRVGEAVGANLMILGSLWKFMDRSGGPAGSNYPASVAFDLYLIDVSSGKLLWMANFGETQRSLSANILDVKTFFSRGGKWLSANELARYGVEEVLKKWPL